MAIALSIFHCLGPITGTKKTFHPKGFLKNSTITSFSSLIEDEDLIVLFGKSFSVHSALLVHSDLLFELCRKSFLQLHGQLTGRGLRISDNDKNDRLRDGICKFLNYILSFIKNGSLDIFTDESNNLEIHLRQLRLLFHKLSLARLPDHALAYFSSTLGTECSSPALPLVHCHLDFRWLFINIAQALEQVKSNQPVASQYTQLTKTSCFCPEEEILLLMNELVWLAIVRYEKADKSELAPFSAFGCVCVKELWLLLMHYPYKSQEFWTYFNQTLRVVLEKIKPPTDGVNSSLKIEPPDFLPCSNRNEFALWFMADMARLLEYNSEGDYVGAGNCTGDKFEMVDDVIRGLLCERESPTEAAMRNLLPLIYKIQKASGHSRSAPILFLWEYYFKKINSAFYIPGSKLNSNIVMSKSGVSLLEEVKTRLDGSTRNKRENSFFMFLRVLGDHLLVGQMKGVPASRLCSRVFLKFSTSRPEKLKELLEPGIFHIASLFLTLAIGTKTSSIVTRLVELLAAIPRTDGMKEAKHEMIWKSYSASLLALEELKADLTESAEIIVNHVDWCIKHSQLTPLSHFVEVLKILFQANAVGAKGLHRIITPWIGTYLTVCRKTDVVRLLSNFVPLVKQLKNCGTQEAQSLRGRVELYVIPTLTNYESTTTAELAAFCALVSPKLKAEIFRHWSGRDDTSVSGKFLATLVAEDGDDILASIPQLQTIIPQVWVRCCFLSGDNVETKSLSSFLAHLPPSSTFQVDWTGPEPFKSFAKYFGFEYSMCQTLYDKSVLKTSFLTFFSNFDKWLEHVCQSLEQMDEGNLGNIYECAADLFVHCRHFIYSKSDNRCLLKIIMDTLVLPRTMYKPDYMPPQKVLSVIIRTLDRFIESLIQLDPERDPYIGRLVKDTAMQYLPRLRAVAPDVHPLVKFICTSSRSQQVLTLFNSTLQHKSGSTPSQAHLVLELFQAVLAIQPSAANKVFEATAESLVALIISLDNLMPLKMRILDCLASLLETPQNRKLMLPVMSDSCKKHMAFNAPAWFDAAKKIVPLCRTELAPLVNVVTVAVKEIEKKRGVENDAILRRLLQNLELAVG